MAHGSQPTMRCQPCAMQVERRGEERRGEEKRRMEGGETNERCRRVGSGPDRSGTDPSIPIQTTLPLPPLFHHHQQQAAAAATSSSSSSIRSNSKSPPCLLTAVLDSLPAAPPWLLCTELDSSLLPRAVLVDQTDRRRSIRFSLCCSGKQPPYVCLQLACYSCILYEQALLTPNLRFQSSGWNMDGWMDGWITLLRGIHVMRTNNFAVDTQTQPRLDRSPC
ncbi:hypothetical protein BDA96_03G001100 [Sorghum bicolor]|uniref:Uncharacterized protein n=2 Tax=Sorghum bicolor TaxID=4558 RepID=A0A921R8B1_SORBI|nr:hypothetical protein BDA96_03G001100 [Sorghum bicolor]KXG31444.1 hypothetical protein SORBI_3003G001000 [Sorghum bicolor]